MRLVSRLPDTARWFRLFPTLLLVALAVALPRPLSGQDADKAAAKLRHWYMQRDYEYAVEHGKQLIAGNSAAREARAWYVLNMARNNDFKEAVEYAESMVTTDPGEMWGLLALAGAYNWHMERGKEALEPSEKALAAAPNNIDAIWLRIEVLRKQDSPAAALEFFDQLPADVQQHPDVLLRKAVAQNFQWNALDAAERKVKPDESVATFEQVRALDSMKVEAYFLDGAYQMIANSDDSEARELLARATTLTPAPDVHQYYWRSIQSRRDMSREQKKAAIDSAIGSLVALRPDQPGVLNAAIGMYGQLKMDDKKLALEERVLADFPNSVAAEWVLVNRYRAVRSEMYEQERATGEKDSVKNAQYVRMVTEFIERPHHRQENLLAEAYRNLFLAVRDDSAVSDEYVYSLVEAMQQHDAISGSLHSGVAVALANRQIHLDEAAQLAQEGIVQADSTVERMRDAPMFESEEDFARYQGRVQSMALDALGWVYFKAGKFDQAEAELNRAFEASSEGLSNLYHLGQFHETMAEQADTVDMQQHLDRAEEFYIKGIAVQTFGDNPSDEALKTLYVNRNGSEEGYADYLERAEELDRERRRAKVVADRIEEPDTIMPFSLETLDSTMVSYADLKGKIVVINFWGVWCGPCVIEMPELQKLHEQYEADPEVVFLTIDYNDDPDDVREWVAKRNYTFRVLLDDGYVSDVDVMGFPTTWFVDRDGFIVYVKLGASEKVHEEFSWRIEALKNPAGG